MGKPLIMGCHEDYASNSFQKKREMDQEWGPRRDMLFAMKGPRSRREFLQLQAREHAEKVQISGNVPNRFKI